MKHYLIFDTETTGFPNKNFAATSSAQARVCQLAAIKVDEQFNEVATLCSLIKPAGWKISYGAFEAHGISMERCEAGGRNMREVLAEFAEMQCTSDASVCHNKAFDNTMLDIEYNCYPDIAYVIPSQKLCTMEICTPICKLPHKNGKKMLYGQAYKWPKLEEAYKFFFNEELKGAHDALNDVRATLRVLKHLVENKFIPSIALESVA